MKIKEKIIGILFFTVLLLGIIYLSLFTSNEVKNCVGSIEISGNHYLSSEEYLKFAMLNKITNLSPDNNFLTPAIIKDRLEKHPYIKKADVKFTRKNEVSVSITEKKFQAIVISEGENFLITDVFELIPILSFTKNIEFPVIANPYLAKKATGFDILNVDEMKTAFKIIDAARLIDHELYFDLTEVNMRNGRDIILSFADFNFPIVIGRGNEINKVIYFDKLWNKINNNKTAQLSINYIDLRFDRLIYLCMSDSDTSQQQGDFEVQEIQG